MSENPNVVAIRFQPLGKLYHFDRAGARDLRPGDYVLVSTRRGREMGEVAGFVEKPKSKNKLKPIERLATAQELVLRRMWQRKELRSYADPKNPVVLRRAVEFDFPEDVLHVLSLPLGYTEFPRMAPPNRRRWFSTTGIQPLIRP